MKPCPQCKYSITDDNSDVCPYCGKILLWSIDKCKTEEQKKKRVEELKLAAIQAEEKLQANQPGSYYRWKEYGSNQITNPGHQQYSEQSDKSRSNPYNKSGSHITSWLLLAFIIVMIGSTFLVPVFFPDISKEAPLSIIGYGAIFVIIGVISWILALAGVVQFKRRGQCCLFMPFIGLPIILYGAYALVSPLFSLTMVTPRITSTNASRPAIASLPGIANTNTPDGYILSLTATAYHQHPLGTQTPPTESGVVGCLNWWEVTYADKGKSLCVTGTVINAYPDGEDEGIYYLMFSKDANAFRFIVLDFYYYKNIINHCVYATGIVKVYGQMPYIELNDNLYSCD